MNRLIIIGAGGHGKVIADLAVKNDYKNICFLDDQTVGDCVGFPIIGKTEEAKSLNDGNTDFVIAIGSNAIRKELAEKYDVNWVTLIHPSAQIGINVTVEKGTVIMANAVVNAAAVIGKHCIINTGAIIEHDNVIEDYVHISPKAALGGTTRIGTLSHIGIGAALRNNINICANCVIGAGAVVIKDIKQSGTYVGVPVRKIK